MKLFIDTNIVVDMLLKREDYKSARDVINLANEGHAVEYVTASSVTDIVYLLTSSHAGNQRKTSGEAQKILSDLLKIVDVASVTHDEIAEALSLDWEDFEDALQYVIAKANTVDFIITRDEKGFINSEIPHVTAKELLEIRNAREKEPKECKADEKDSSNSDDAAKS